MQQRGICSTEAYPDLPDEKFQDCQRLKIDKRRPLPVVYGKGMTFRLTFGDPFENDVIQYLKEKQLPVTIGSLINFKSEN